MYEPFDDPNFNREVQDKLREKLQEIADLIGPRVCAHGYWRDCEEECEWSDTSAEGVSMINHFVLVASFESMAGGIPSVSVIPAAMQHDYVTAGLLHEALYE